MSSRNALIFLLPALTAVLAGCAIASPAGTVDRVDNPSTGGATTYTVVVDASARQLVDKTPLTYRLVVGPVPPSGDASQIPTEQGTYDGTFQRKIVANNGDLISITIHGGVAESCSITVDGTVVETHSDGFVQCSHIAGQSD